MLYSSGLHSDGITEELKQYSIEEKSVTHLTSYLNTIKMKDTEQLYNRMFNDLMKNSGKYFFKLSPKAATTLGEEILAGRKFGGNKIWRNWREFNLADAKKC